MRSLVSCKLLRLLVFVRRQQLAKNISRGFFIARHIYRNTWRETKTFKRAVKHISHHKHLNAGSIQVMELVFHECIGCIRHSYTQTKGNRYEICMCYYTVLRSSPSSLSPTITLPNWMKKLYTFWTQCDIHTNISQNSITECLLSIYRLESFGFLEKHLLNTMAFYMLFFLIAFVITSLATSKYTLFWNNWRQLNCLSQNKRQDLQGIIFQLLK